MTSENRDIEEFASKLDRRTRQVFDALREVLFQAEPAVSETIRWGRPVYSMQRDICRVEPVEQGLMLGFPHALDLTDPPELLDGSWAEHRTILLSDPDEVKNAQFIGWMDELVKQHRRHQRSNGPVA